MKQQKDGVANGGVFWLKGLIWLFCIMLLFTIISRISDSFTVAKVEVCRPSARRLQYMVAAEGRIEKNREISVLTQPELLVKSVLVSEGQRVAKGDVLAELDLNQLAERIAGIRDEIEALELQNQAYEANLSQARQKRAKALAQARRDYRRLLKEHKVVLAAARKELAAARRELAADKKNLEKKAAVVEKKAALKELRTAAAKEREEAERAVEEAGEEPAADNSIKVNNITIRSLQEQVDKLTDIQTQEGKIRAPESGVVTGILVGVGQKTPDAGIFVMTDDSAGLKFAGQISVSDAKYISVGDGITLTSADQKLEDIPVTSLEMDESREYINLMALLPGDTFSLGESVTMTKEQESGNYSCTVPVTALRQESGRTFVLVVETEDTVLGEQEMARLVEVTVREKNESYAALEDGALDSESEIIIDSDRYVQTGDRVRSIEEEGEN